LNRFILLILIFSPLLAFSTEEAFFRPQSRTQIELKEGDSFSGVIELWNIRNVSSEMINEIKGNSFLDDFYVVSLEKPKWSENNPEVVLIEGVFILQNKVQSNDKLWILGGLKIPIKVKEIETYTLEKKNKKFLIMDGQYKFDDSESYLFWYLGLCLLTISGVVIIIVFKKNKKKEIAPFVEINWNSKLKLANSRDDFLYLYLNRQLWIKEENTTTEEFSKLCNDYLFKKEVQDYEMEQLTLIRDTLAKVAR
jgi:hypothetical protein